MTGSWGASPKHFCHVAYKITQLLHTRFALSLVNAIGVSEEIMLIFSCQSEIFYKLLKCFYFFFWCFFFLSLHYDQKVHSHPRMTIVKQNN